MTLRSYWTNDCGTCAIKVTLHDRQGAAHQALGARGRADSMQKRLDQVPQAMILRRQTVEHPSAPSRRGWATS